MKIGIAGTGRMGAALAARLAGLGHEMAVWNRSAERARALGLALAASPAALAQSCETIISILADGDAVSSVFAQFLQGAVKDRLFIDMSTVRPEVTRHISKQLRSHGAAFVECPVGGSVAPAREGRLFGFVGGEPADVARARPLLEQLCRRIEHVGPAGAGASMKLAVNLPLLVYYQALGEALSLLKPLDLHPHKVMDIIGESSGAPAMLKHRGPQIAAVLAGNAPPAVTVDIDTVRKDLREMLAEARSLGVELPLSAAALECYDQASRAGLGANDCTLLPAFTLSKPR